MLNSLVFHTLAQIYTLRYPLEYIILREGIDILANNKRERLVGMTASDMYDNHATELEVNNANLHNRTNCFNQ